MFYLLSCIRSDLLAVSEPAELGFAVRDIAVASSRLLDIATDNHAREEITISPPPGKHASTKNAFILSEYSAACRTSPPCPGSPSSVLWHIRPQLVQYSNLTSRACRCRPAECSWCKGNPREKDCIVGTPLQPKFTWPAEIADVSCF